MTRAVIVINPVSGPARRGRGADRAEVARQTLARLGARGEVRLTERAGHAHELALEAAASGAEIVIAWGGDGTINEVGRALVQHAEAGGAAGRAGGPALGIVPGGSGNGLARELRIPFDPAQAIERAVRTAPRAIDAGELGDHLFFNIAGVGLDAHVAALVSTRVHHRGVLPYLKAGLADLVRYRPVEYTFEVEGRTTHLSAVILALANSAQYGFGARIAPRARLDDGLLDLIAIEDRAFLGNLARAPYLFLGRLDRRPGVDVRQVRAATIRAGAPMLFHVDGEAVQGADTLVARVRPGALLLRA